MQYYFYQAWDKDDVSEVAFYEAKFDCYKFVARALNEDTSEDVHKEDLMSVNAAKKSKLSIADMANPGHDGVTITVVHETWHKCNAKVKSIEQHLKEYTTTIGEIKSLQARFMALPDRDPAREGYMMKVLQEIQEMEIKSMQQVTAFSGFDKEECDALSKFFNEVDTHQKMCLELWQAAKSRIQKNESYLNSL